MKLSEHERRNGGEVIQAIRASFIALALVSTLPGCVAPYKEPVGTQTASIEFFDDAAAKMSVHLYGDALECRDRVGVGLIEAKGHRAVLVPAGRNLVFTVGMDVDSASKALLGFGAMGGLLMAATYKGCTPTIEFTPEVGKTYEFRMDSDGKDCPYKFYAKPSASSRSQDAQSVVFATREWIRPMGEAGPFCKKR